MSRLARLVIVGIFVLSGLFGVVRAASAQAETGVVAVQKYYCTYLDETLLVEAIDVNECVTGAATFTFYLIGDGTADYEQLTVGSDGYGEIELPVGSYEMVEEGTLTRFNLTVGTVEQIQLLIGNPAVDVDPTAPASAPTTPSAPSLPDTGSGPTSSSGPMMAAVAFVALAMLVGALAIHRRRPS